MRRPLPDLAYGGGSDAQSRCEAELPALNAALAVCAAAIQGEEAAAPEMACGPTAGGFVVLQDADPSACAGELMMLALLERWLHFDPDTFASLGLFCGPGGFYLDNRGCGATVTLRKNTIKMHVILCKSGRVQLCDN